MRICPHCGSSNSDSSKRCESCGSELIAEDRKAEVASENSSFAEKKTTSGLIGSMGKTQFIPGGEREEAGDVQEHISGFGHACETKSDSCEPQAGEGPLSERGCVRGSLLGSVGEVKFSPVIPVNAEDPECRESTLYGRVGTVEFHGPKTASRTERSVDSTSGLLGSVGNSVYVTDYDERREPSVESEIRSSDLVGSMGKSRYTGSGKAATLHKTSFKGRAPRKNKWLRIAAAGAIMVAAVIILSIVSFTSKKENSSGAETGQIVRELVALSKSLKENTESAEEYYRSNSMVLEIIDASASFDMLTEAEAIVFLHDRGFDQFPVMYYYSVGGNYCGETVAEEASRDRRPIYQTNYMSSEGVLWKIHIVNGDIFASPIVFTQNGSFGTPIVISESSALCSYDNMTDRFFVTVPYPEELKVTVVERLDYTALEDLTVEEITAP